MFQGLNFVGNRKLGLGILLSLLTGCGGGTSESSHRLALALIPPENCASIRDKVWNELYRQVDVYGKLPSAQNVVRSVDAELAASEVPEKQKHLRRELASVYSEIHDEVQAGANPSAESEEQESDEVRATRLKRLAEIELGDRTTEEKARFQDALETRLNTVNALVAEANPECALPERETPASLPSPTTKPTPTSAPTPSPSTVASLDPNADPTPFFDDYRKGFHPAVYGAYKTMSVAYQSCGVMKLPALDLTTRVKGIEIVGDFPGGGGFLRKVASADSILSTNPYYKNQLSPGKGCFIEENNPLIYAYGGKPFVSSQMSSELNLFKNGGTGTISLGIDCSGYVSSAILVGGLRLKKEASSKAFQTLGVNSAMFSKPEVNGLSCLKTINIKTGETLLAGDILASSGHIILIDSTTSDPFGISAIKSINQCTAPNVDSSKFQFTITQSSPVLGGIGIDRMKASEYLKESPSMRQAMNSYALAFCKAKFGSVTTPPDLPATLVRHLGTSECRDHRITLKYETCMQKCPVNSKANFLDLETFSPL